MSRTALQSLALLLALIAAVAPARAGETPWQELAPGSSLRLVSADAPDASGQVWAALEIRLAPGTKTYWRVPGETGIPVTIAVTDPATTTLGPVDWPLPQREFTGTYMDYVFYDRLVLPFALSGLTDGNTVEFAVTMGLCSDICVPVTATVLHAFDLDAADPAQSLRIAQARALAPVDWPGAGPSITLDAASGALDVTGLPPDVDDDSLIVEVVDSSLLFGPAEPGTAGALRFEPLGRRIAPQPGDTVRLTFATPEGAFHTHLVIPS